MRVVCFRGWQGALQKIRRLGSGAPTNETASGNRLWAYTTLWCMHVPPTARCGHLLEQVPAGQGLLLLRTAPVRRAIRHLMWGFDSRPRMFVPAHVLVSAIAPALAPALARLFALVMPLMLVRRLRLKTDICLQGSQMKPRFLLRHCELCCLQARQKQPKTSTQHLLELRHQPRSVRQNSC